MCHSLCMCGSQKTSFKTFFKVFIFCFMWTCVLPATGAFKGQKRGMDSLKLEYQMAMNYLPGRCLELNRRPLEEQPVR